VAGHRQTIPRKPDPAGALELARMLGCAAHRCLFVGDTKVDMQTARAAGMTAIGVSWGFRARPELIDHGAAHVLDHPAELLALL